MEDLQDLINDKKREYFRTNYGHRQPNDKENNPTFEEILESMPFKPASRITEADEKNNTKT